MASPACQLYQCTFLPHVPPATQSAPLNLDSGVTSAVTLALNSRRAASSSLSASKQASYGYMITVESHGAGAERGFRADVLDDNVDSGLDAQIPHGVVDVDSDVVFARRHAPVRCDLATLFVHTANSTHTRQS